MYNNIIMLLQIAQSAKINSPTVITVIVIAVIVLRNNWKKIVTLKGRKIFP